MVSVTFRRLCPGDISVSAHWIINLWHQSRSENRRENQNYYVLRESKQDHSASRITNAPTRALSEWAIVIYGVIQAHFHLTESNTQ